MNDYFQFWQAKAMYDLITTAVFIGVFLIGGTVLIGLLMLRDKVVNWSKGCVKK